MGARERYTAYQRNAKFARHIPRVVESIFYASHDLVGYMFAKDYPGYAEHRRTVNAIAERYERFQAGDMSLFERMELAEDLARALPTLWNELAKVCVWGWQRFEQLGPTLAGVSYA